eukprot:gnl/TRDRNA2_/TRDRNA2_36782_c0_seq1.p1 gnl/TRDRNA2_/TRDRNA2_36782_c0~~gnl/TRDRNA2_/TRDRNA2_36782_c0_seq1.p1  ORF type:complete len:500 (-),score=65.64 gnl/TRDRNA2_/TRDRNA2_36782_c0_seq1:65-1564(-)
MTSIGPVLLSLCLSTIGAMHIGKRNSKLTETPPGTESHRSSVVARMMYWKGADAPVSAAVAPKSDRYLLFDYDSGGLNNIRMGWEMAAVAAVESNRTLVYAPWKSLYLVDREPSGLDYWINVDRAKAGLSLMSLKEFVEKEKGNLPIPSEVVQWASQPGHANDQIFPRILWKQFRKSNMASAGYSLKAVCDINSYRGPDRFVYTDPTDGDRIFTCGNWPNVGEPRFMDSAGGRSKPWHTPNWAFSLLRNHFVWHPEAFDIASRVVDHLGLFSYVSAHVRYGDFQFQANKTMATNTILKDGWLSLLQDDSATHRDEATTAYLRGQRTYNIVRKWLDEPGPHRPRSIYIATDEKSRAFLKPFRDANLTVYRWEELMDDAYEGRGPLALVVKTYTPERLQNLAGVVEQLICSFGRVFIGSEKSTFSGYAERMRLYAQAPTHATFIRYNGFDIADKGMRLLHHDKVDPKIDQKVTQQLEDWDRAGGKLDREDPGVLPQGDGCC